MVTGSITGTFTISYVAPLHHSPKSPIPCLHDQDDARLYFLVRREPPHTQLRAKRLSTAGSARKKESRCRRHCAPTASQISTSPFPLEMERRGRTQAQGIQRHWVSDITWPSFTLVRRRDIYDQTGRRPTFALPSPSCGGCGLAGVSSGENRSS